VAIVRRLHACDFADADHRIDAEGVDKETTRNCASRRRVERFTVLFQWLCMIVGDEVSCPDALVSGAFSTPGGASLWLRTRLGLPVDPCRDRHALRHAER
jgi:hypothetical protein